MRKQDAILARAERDKWKKISKQHKKNQRPLWFSLNFIIMLFIYIDKEKLIV